MHWQQTPEYHIVDGKTMILKDYWFLTKTDEIRVRIVLASRRIRIVRDCRAQTDIRSGKRSFELEDARSLPGSSWMNATSFGR